MKQNQLTAALVVLLLLCTLGTVWLTYSYNISLHKLHQLEPKVASLTPARSLIQSVINDTLEYSKRNPAIDPLLQSLKLKEGAPAMPAPKSAAR